MSALHTAGDVLPVREDAARITEMHLRLIPMDLIVQWQRCSITADFFARTLALHFQNRPGALHVLSHGFNELIENLAKFSADKKDPVDIVVIHYGDQLRVRTTNLAHKPQADALASRLNRMATTDPEELFLEQIEHTASQDQGASGLGLITIKKDYGALIGAEITAVQGRPGLFAVVLTLELDVETVEGA